jgi:hypothetical protein
VQTLLNPDIASSIEPPDADRRTSGDLALAVSGVLWLAYILEVGDPLRERLPKTVARLRREVTDPDHFLVSASSGARRTSPRSTATRSRPSTTSSTPAPSP